MIKPIWAAVGGVALLGAAGGIGIVVSSSGGDRGLTELKTAAPTASAKTSPLVGVACEIPAPSPYGGTCDPTSAPEGTKLWRWGDVTVVIREGSAIRAFGTDVGRERRPALEISLGSWARVVIDASTRAIISEESSDRGREFASAIGTVLICPFDASAAPWPYNGEPPNKPRMIVDHISYLEPDPAAGIQIEGGGVCGMSTSSGSGGCRSFLVVRNATALDIETGLPFTLDYVVQEDREAFARILPSIHVEKP